MRPFTSTLIAAIILAMFPGLISAAEQALPAVRPGVLPDASGPIAYRQLVDLAVLLRLPDDAWNRVEKAHAHYVDEFRLLREEYFEKLLRLSWAVSTIPEVSPDRKTIELYVRTQRDMERSIDRLDLRLFDAIGEQDRAEANGILERFRQRRRLDRAMADPLMAEWFITGSFTDLVAILEDLGAVYSSPFDRSPSASPLTLGPTVHSARATRRRRRSEALTTLCNGPQRAPPRSKTRSSISC